MEVAINTCLASRKRKSPTKTQYAKYLEEFRSFLSKESSVDSPSKLTKEHFQRYVEHVQEKPGAPNSKRTHIIAVKTFAESFEDESLAESVALPPIAQQDTEEAIVKVMRLLDVATKEKKWFLALLYYASLSIEQAITVRYEDVEDVKRGSTSNEFGISKRSLPPKKRFKRKGVRVTVGEDRVWVKAEGAEILREVLACQKENRGKYLFSGKGHGQHLSKRSGQHWIRGLCRAAKVEKITGHTISKLWTPLASMTHQEKRK